MPIDKPKPEIEILPQIQELIQTAQKTEKDCYKFDQGNMRAGRRVRKVMQKIRRQVKKIRDDIQAGRNHVKNVKINNPEKFQKPS